MRCTPFAALWVKPERNAGEMTHQNSACQLESVPKEERREQTRILQGRPQPQRRSTQERQALGEFKRTSDQKKKSEDSQESENRSPAKNDFQPASEDGRHHRCKPEDDGRIRHDRLGIWSGKAVDGKDGR